jgi:DNA-binding response OmpR family regulator
MPSATILSIEDQPDIRRLIRMTLEFKGYHVLEAGNGQEGLRMAREQQPDLVLLDVMMPGISGLDVSRTLSAEPRLQRIPVVMLSALGASSDIEAGLGTGVRAYLVKPFSPWELLDLVAQLLAQDTPQDGSGPRA